MDLGTAVACIHAQKEEIESLRKWQQEKIRMDAEEGGRLDGYRELGQRAAEAESERDEWKHRARSLWNLMYNRSEFLQIYAEAAEWFEEE